MKKFVLMLLAAALLLTLAGCAPEPADEQAMAEDVAGRLAQPSGEAEIGSLSVIKRQTDKGAKTDLVYVQVDYATPASERSERYKLTYGLYNEGWILDEMEPYEQQTWTLTPLAEPDEQTVAALLPEGAELTQSQFDPDSGVQTVTYTVEGSYAYCELSRTEQMTMTMTEDEQWQAGEPTLLEQRQDWDRLVGFWDCYGGDDEDDEYEIEALVLPFEQDQLHGYTYYEAMGTNKKMYTSLSLEPWEGTDVVSFGQLLEPVEGEALPTFRSTLGDDSLFRLDPDDGLVFLWQGREDQAAALEQWPLETEGTWGDTVWRMDPDETLTVGGQGPMAAPEDGAGWSDYEGMYRAVVIEPGVTAVSERAFRRSRITSASLPEGLESIGEAAFAGCKSLRTIQLPEGLTQIGAEAFAGSGLTSVTIPDSVTAIGDGAFANCPDLAQVHLPEGVQLGQGVFEGCYGLDLPEAAREAIEAVEESAEEAEEEPMEEPAEEAAEAAEESAEEAAEETAAGQSNAMSKDQRTVEGELIGAQVEELIARIGQPVRSEYSASALVADGQDGVLYYDGFQVLTTRFANGEEYVMGTAN